jgi:hypothetical protein
MSSAAWRSKTDCEADPVMQSLLNELNKLRFIILPPESMSFAVLSQAGSSPARVNQHFQQTGGMQGASRRDCGFQQPLIWHANYIQQKGPLSRKKRFI